MKLTVLEAILEGRADLERRGLEPPYVCHLGPKRATRLRAELRSLRAAFGIPLGGFVPDPKEEGEYLYLGLILGDVHVFVESGAMVR